MKTGSRVAALVLAAALAGCAASATQTWRPASDLSAPAWVLKGSQGAWGRVVVTINDQPALSGTVSVFSGKGELTGSYEGKTLTGACQKGRGSSVRTQCAISVDGRKVTTLYFRVK
jgi:hypothetical protein